MRHARVARRSTVEPSQAPPPRSRRWWRRRWRPALALAGGWVAAVVALSPEPVAALERQWPLALLVVLALLAGPGIRPSSPRRSLRDYWFLDGGGAMGD